MPGCKSAELIRRAFSFTTIAFVATMLGWFFLWSQNVFAATAQDIANKAKDLAWSYGTSSSIFKDRPTDAFVQAAGRVNSGLNNNNCLSFVKVVVIDSGADTSFPSDDSLQETDLVEYMGSSDKWEQIETTNESDLRSGDILVSADNSGQGRNHIFIYLGDGKVAGANLNAWYGRVGNLATEWELGESGTPFYYSGNQYKVFRLSDNTGTNTTNANSTNTSGRNTASNKRSGTSKSDLSESRLEEFAQNDIMFYDPSYDPSADDCVNGHGTTFCTAPSGNEITWIGDSYSILANNEEHEHLIDSTFPGVDYGGPIDQNVNYGLGDGTTYIASGKCVDQEGIDDNVSDNPSGLSILERIKNEGKLRPYLVFALGDNKGWTQDMMDKFLGLVGDDTKVILVTSETYNSRNKQQDVSIPDNEENYDSSNAILRKAAEEHSNIYLADWSAAYKDEYYPAAHTDGDDGGHPSVGDGFKAWIQVIKNTLISAAGGVSSVSSSTNSSEDTPPKEITGSDITWIGDSYSVGAQAIIEREFSGITFGGTVNTDQSTIQDCKNVMIGFSNPCGGSSTSNPSGIAVLRREIADNKLKPYLVFALGTNNGWNDESMAEFNEIMSEHPDTKVVLVTSRTPGDDYAGSNDILKKMVDENSNYVLADWAAVYKESYFDGDPERSHPVSDGGFDEWVKVIKDALGAVAGDDNGCTTYEGEYPEYMQGAEPWGGMPYGSGCTYASCACGAASIAMLATVITGQDIFPTDITDYLATKFELPYYNQEDFGQLDTEVGKHYGFEVKVDYAANNEEAETKFRQYLSDGYMLHFVGSGCYPGFQSGGYCSDGHYIGIYKMVGNDNVMQANSGWGGNQESSLDDVIKAMGGGKFTAVRGNGGGKNTCNGICNVASNAVNIGSNGLTEEQAQKIADYYNSDEVTPNNFIDGDIPSTCDKMNCVSFSFWFVSAFTDAVDHGGTFSGLVNHGSYIADTGLPGIGWKTGNEIKPFSVFGGSGTSAWSHTGVVVGKKSDDEIITIEAAYDDDGAGNCTGHDAWVEIKPKEYFAEGVGILAYSDDHLTPSEGHLGNKSMNEVLGR